MELCVVVFGNRLRTEAEGRDVLAFWRERVAPQRSMLLALGAVGFPFNSNVLLGHRESERFAPLQKITSLLVRIGHGKQCTLPRFVATKPIRSWSNRITVRRLFASVFTSNQASFWKKQEHTDW